MCVINGAKALESRDSKKSTGQAVIDLLDKGLAGPPQPFYVVVGQDDFLRRHGCRMVRDLVHGKPDSLGDSPGTTIRTDGDSLDLATFLDELGTASLFGGKTLFRVDEADDFVSKYRQALEKQFSNPGWAGVALLVVDSWPSNTRLAKLTPAPSLLRCDVPERFSAATWARTWARQNHQVELAPDAARALEELLGKDLGRLDQEIAKLACGLPPGANTVTADMVDKLVSGGTQELVWKIFNAISSGNPGQALSILDDQYVSGNAVESSMRLQGALAFQLRKIARAARRAKSGASVGLPQAMTEAGIRPGFFQKDAETLMRHLGGRRLFRLMDDLARTDLALKGGSRLPQRTVLEKLIVNLAVPEHRSARGG